MNKKKYDESLKVGFAMYRETLLIFSAILIGSGLREINSNPIVLIVLGVIFLFIYIALKVGLKRKYTEYF
jgi:hypothetical protein